MHYCALDHPHAGLDHRCSCGARAAVAVDETVTLDQLALLGDVIEADQ